MEALLHQSKAMCPFLNKTTPATLRSMSTATQKSPGGGTITNLQFIARRCPVMNKALAVQAARLQCPIQPKCPTPPARAFKSIAARKIHNTADRKASIDTENYGKKKGEGS